MMLRLLCIAAVAPALAFVSRPAARLSRPVAARVCRRETVRCAAIPLGKQSDEDYVSSIPIESPPVDATNELPKVNGAIIAGKRKLCVITGASSGLGKEAARALCESGDYFVIMACRDVEKAKRVAEEEGFPANSYTVMKLELGSLASVRNFVFNLKVGRGARTPSARAERRDPVFVHARGTARVRRSPLSVSRVSAQAFKATRPLDRLVCNAAVYLPADPIPRFTDDGFEMSVGVNHLGHFLLCNLLLDDMKNAKVRDANREGAIRARRQSLTWPAARVPWRTALIIVGSMRATRTRLAAATCTPRPTSAARRA